MKITCLQPLEIAYPDKDGNVKKVLTRPGSHEYPMLDHKDPMVAEQLRVFRKHTRIGFDEILESDKPILAEMKDEKDKAAKLLEKSGLQPSPVGRIVKGKKDARRNPKSTKSTSKTVEKRDPDKSGRKVSE